MAIVTLISGGLDSAVLAAQMHTKHDSQTALTIDYGQIQKREIMSARDIAKLYADQHKIMECNLSYLSRTALTGVGPMPEGVKGGISEVYLPGRNTVFLSLAVTLAEAIGADSVAIGCNADDAEGFPDCRVEYFDAYNDMLCAIGSDVLVGAPFIFTTKAKVVALGRELGVDFNRTISCYRGTNCGRCEACIRRRKALANEHT